MTEQVINSKQSLEAYKKYLDVQYEKHKYIRVSSKTGKQRTLTQNASLHKFCELLADALNDAGYDFREFIKEGLDVPFTPELVKNNIWRPIQVIVTGKESTTKPERHEYGQIYDVVNMHMIKKDIFVPWPSKDTMNTLN